MTDTTPTSADRPADQLRAAAEKLRAAAMGSPMNSSPWRYAKGLPSDSVRTEAGWEVVYGDAPGDLRYIALMHPGVGLALAAWLDHHAAMSDRLTGLVEGAPDGSDHPALAVARQLLGTSAAEGGDESCGRFVPDTPRAPGLCASCGDAKGWHSLLATAEPAAPPAPADRAATRDRIRRAICEAEGFAWDTDMLEPDEYGEVADAVLAVLADDAAAGVQPPTSETEPARRRLTPNEHDRAWYAIEGSAGEDGADPDTILNAVLHALRIDAPTAAEEQAASPSRRATPPAAPAAPEETQ
ncbi:hypothetical protein [Streptomyces anulatus]|uniref:hypothetical protein n=1 Tax=Streptomyces anulatus TaxID=1892 RepID=UPI0036A05DCD